MLWPSSFTSSDVISSKDILILAINLSEAKMSVNKESIKAKQGQKLKSSINDSICISYKMSEMKPE